MNQSVFTEYASVSAQIAELEAKKKELNEKCLTQLTEIAGQKLNTDLGTFSTMIRKKYKLPEEVVKQIDDYKTKAKKLEVETISKGGLEFEETISLRFQLTK